MEEPRYKRVLIKVSGEALAGGERRGIDFSVVEALCDVIVKCQKAGVEIGIVVGGGNFWRGVQDAGGRMDRSRADHMGMLATVINSLAIADVLEKRGVEVRVQTAIEMRSLAEPYVRSRAVRHLEKGRIVIFACGTGNPFFTTDTAASLRAAEVGAEVVMLAKKVDYVYDADPKTNPNAKKMHSLTYDELLARHLKVIDSTAASFAQDNDIPTILFALQDPENIYRIIMGENLGTIIKKN